MVALFARHTLSPAAVETFGTVAGILAQALARKQAEEALLKEKEFSDEVINSLPGVFYVFDAQNQLRRWNRNFESLSGYSGEELQRMMVLDFLAPADHQFAREAIAKVLATGEASAELLFLTKAGREIPFSFTGHRLIVDGQPGFLGVGLDVTERKQAQQALRETEERFRVLFETSPLSTFLIDPETQSIVECNDQAGRSLGYTREQLRQLRIADFEAQLGPEQIAGKIAQISEGRQLSFETRHRTRTGEMRDVIVTARALQLQGRQMHYATATDITEQKQAQLTLQRWNQHLQILHELAARLLVSEHPVALLADLHNQIARTLGVDVFMIYQPVEGSRRMRLTACGGVTPEEELKLKRLHYGRAICARPSDALHPIIATNIQTIEAPNRRFIRKLGFRSYLYYPLVLNQRLQGTLAFASRERDEYDAMDLNFFHTVAGTLAEALERRRLASELQRHAANLDNLVRDRTAKLEQTVAELEHFSYTITHDMRAPLRAMTGFAQMLTASHAQSLPEAGRDFLRRIREGALRMDHLITDALQYRPHNPLGNAPPASRPVSHYSRHCRVLPPVPAAPRANPCGFRNAPCARQRSGSHADFFKPPGKRRQIRCPRRGSPRQRLGRNRAWLQSDASQRFGRERKLDRRC